MGYRGLRIVGENGGLAGDGLQGGDTYRVRSAYPELDPQRLRLDHSRGVTPLFTNLPSGSQRLEHMAQQITRGAGSDFERAKLIVSYLGQWGEFDPRRPGDLTSSAPLDQFLFEGKAGSTLDFATATVMLARASGLPARLAVGYLPGGRDSLSGAYQVRESDAHAWAEIFFADHGWVPFDSTPRSKEVFPGGVRSGVGRLFQGGPGEDLYSAVKAAPSQLGGFLGKVLGNPMLSILVPLLVGGLVLLRWLYLRSGRGNQTNRKKGWLAYSSLPGEGRRDLLHIYAQVERLLRRRWRVRRMPWQTVGDYTALAADGNQDLQGQLSWFAQATWQAAYNPGELPAGLVQEARSRLARLKAALKTMKGLATLQ